MLALTQGIMTVSNAPRTVALLRMNGTNGSTSFPDETGKSWTAFGNAQVTTTTPQFGTGAALFDGSGDYIESGIEADFGFGTGDFAFECFFRPTALSGNHTLFCLGTNWIFYYNSFGAIFVFDRARGVNVLSSSNGLIAAGTYYHAEWGRQAGTMYLQLAGARVAAVADAFNFGSSNRVQIGRDVFSGGSSFMNGRIDEARISNIARNPGASYTVPAGQFILD